MATSSFSNSKTEVLLPSDPPQWQTPNPDAQRRRRDFVSLKLLILASIVFSIVGCTNTGSSPTSWTFIEIKEIESRKEVASHADSLLPTPISLPEPTFTSEPSATPTQIIVVTPTSTPTSTPLPTATSEPVVIVEPPTPTEAPSSGEIINVVIISIDGLRPDALDLANTPAIDKLRENGSYCPHAQTLNISITLPSHASMLSGMLPEKHGITWGLPYIGWPGMEGPTLFNVAHDAGLTTAMVFGKQKLNYLILPNSVDRVFSADVHDMEIKDNAVKFIRDGLPNILFIHFPDTDRVGHAYGWMSPNQLDSITYVDNLIGEIVAELKSGGYLNNTLLIITSDHGGDGFGHGDDSPLHRTIPWLATGPGVPSGLILNGHINTYDTAATALYALKLPIPEKWDGQPILDIFPDRDHLQLAARQR